MNVLSLDGNWYKKKKLVDNCPNFTYSTPVKGADRTGSGRSRKVCWNAHGKEASMGKEQCAPSGYAQKQSGG